MYFTGGTAGPEQRIDEADGSEAGEGQADYILVVKPRGCIVIDNEAEPAIPLIDEIPEGTQFPAGVQRPSRADRRGARPSRPPR